MSSTGPATPSVPAAHGGPTLGSTPVLICSASLGAGVGVVFPLLAEFQDRYGFSDAGLGMLSAATFLAALVSGLFLAGLADRGHVRTLLVVGMALSAVGMLWFAISSELWQFSGARLLEGLGYGLYLPAARKIVTAGDPGSAGMRLGRLTSAEFGGFLAGQVVGSLLSEMFGLSAPLVVMGVIQVGLALWMVAVALPPVPTSRARRSPLASFRMLRRPSVFGAAMLSLALFLPIGVYDALWSRYLTDRGASTLFIGIGLSLYAVPIVLFAPTGGRIADRFGPVRAASIAICVVIPLTLSYGLLAAPLLITAAGLMQSIPEAVGSPAVQTVMLRACRPDEVASGQGVAHAVNQVGAGSAALLGPIVYGAYGSEVLFAGLALAMAVLFSIGVALHRRGGGEARVELT